MTRQRDQVMSPPIPHLSLRTTNLNVYSDMEYDSRSSSAYPPSSATSDSEVETPTSPNSASLRSAISSLHDFELRSILVKLADTNPRFQHAIMKEIARVQPFVSETRTPTKSSRSKKSKTRRRSQRNHHNLSLSTEKLSEAPTTVHDESVYHPGRLGEEVYEFLSRSPIEDVAFKDVRTIAMWSCCDEDETSPGCMTASPMKSTFASHHTEYLSDHDDPHQFDLGPQRGRSPTRTHSAQTLANDVLPDDSDVEPVTARQTHYYYHRAQRYHHPRNWNST